MSAEAEIEGVLRAFAAAYASRDLAALSALFAQDSGLVMYGTQANLHLVGWPAMEDSLRRQLAAIEDAIVTHRDMRVRVLAGGHAAAVASLVDYRARIGGAPFDIRGVRATYALERLDGLFRIVHMHWSIARGEVLVEH